MQRDGMKGKKALSGLCLAAAVLVIVWVSWRNGIVNYYLSQHAGAPLIPGSVLPLL